MKKIVLFLISILMLNGCFNKSGCLVLPQSVHCFHQRTIYPHLARFQKAESIGYTDPVQRWKDAMVCGAQYGDDDLNWSFKENFDVNGKIDLDTKGKFMDCMKVKKKYITFYPAECGYQEKPTGKCNL